MVSAFTLSKYIIKSIPVDNLKLQKLLYYSQAVHLVLYDKQPLFPEDIEAWDIGPLIPSVYREYKQYGFETIPSTEKLTPLSLVEKKAVDMSLDYFGKMSGLDLINEAHSETPWEEVYKRGQLGLVISHDSIYDYFKKNLTFTEEELESAMDCYANKA